MSFPSDVSKSTLPSKLDKFKSVLFPGPFLGTRKNFSDLKFEFQNLHEAPLVAQREFELKLASVIVHQVSTRTFAVAMAI